MASGAPAGLLGHAVVAGIYKLHPFSAFLQPKRPKIGTHRIRGGVLVFAKSRANVSPVFPIVVLRRILSRAVHHRGIPAMAIGASEAHRSRSMHRRAIDGIVAARTHAAARLSVGFVLCLQDQKLRSSPLRAFGDALSLILRRSLRFCGAGLLGLLRSMMLAGSIRSCCQTRDEHQANCEAKDSHSTNAARPLHLSPELTGFNLPI